MELAKVIFAFVVCAGIVVGIGAINIWLGILAMPIVSELFSSIVKK